MDYITQTTSKGFKVIQVTKEQAGIIWHSPGICDSCMESPAAGTYIAVLNCYYCQNCFDGWHKTAQYYPEDAAIEARRFEDTSFKLELI